jgi:trehalose-6-phosphate synthase
LGGTWVAHGSASADRLAVDEKDHVFLPPRSREYMLRRVWLTRREEKGYYYGISNRALWPLCHMVYTRPTFSRTDWEIYQEVNRRFCDAVLEEIGEDPAIIFIQDYHPALLPRFLKNKRPDLKIVLFWHIPWPNREVFRIFPWGEELLDGMLAADIVGFHIHTTARTSCTRSNTWLKRPLIMNCPAPAGETVKHISGPTPSVSTISRSAVTLNL